MFPQMLRFLAPPVFPDEEKSRKAQLLNLILLSLIALVLLSIVLLVWLDGEDIRELYGANFSFVFLLAAVVIMRRGYIEAAAFMTAVVIWIGVTLATFNYGGVLNHNFTAYIVPIIILNLFINWKTAATFAVVSVIVGIIAPEHTPMPTKMETLIEISILFFFMTSILYLANQYIQQSFQRVKQHDLALAQMNEELQREIEERRRVEAALRDNEERFQIALELSGMVIYTQDTDLCYTWIRNSSFGEPDAILGKRDDDFFSPGDAALLNAVKQQVVESGERAHQIFHVSVNGKTSDWDTIIEATRDVEENINGIMGASYEVTQIKQAEQALRESHARYQMLLEKLPVAIVVSRFDSRIAYTNPAGLKLLGASRLEEVIGHSYDEFAAPQSLGLIQQRRQGLSQGQPMPVVEYKMQRLNQEIVDVEVTAILTDYEDQQAILGVLNDITERKRAQHEIMQAEMLRIEMEKEKRLLSFRDDFVRLISHEFRTPLAIIRSSTGLLEKYYDQMTEERRQSHYQKMEDQIEQMLSMLDDILTISQAGSGMMNITLSAANVEFLCTEFIDSIQSTDKYQHPIKLITDGQQYHFMIAPRLLRHCVINLLSNAVKYSLEGSPVYLELERDEQEITLRVRDQGIGIPPQNLDKIFESFYRADNVGDIRGTGLGLSIVKLMTELQGGTVTCESEIGKGTIFTLKLPIIRQIQPNEGTARAAR
jgi:PAS domain S-box-containing protein